ncbi:MAG: MBL fold metallo-hydrolase [Lachnospiraceae bacterium]|nr:MBL fold metallo-hydrolase [Lachnospiraceae bacterium]
MSNFKRIPLNLIVFFLSFFLCACGTPAESNEDINYVYDEWQEMLAEKWSIFSKVEIDSNWFSVFELPSNVYAFYEMPYEQDICSYLILGKEKALLWDTGMGIEKIRPHVEELTDLPVIVLNSHDDFDHIGGNSEFDEVWCYDIDIAVQHLTSGPTEAEMKELSDEIKRIATVMDLTDIAVPDHIPGKAPTKTVKDGELINLGGRTLEIIYTPGHTASSIMLFDKENSMLFTGDTYYPGPLYVIRDDSSFSDFVISVRKAADLAESENIEWIIGSHNYIEKGTNRLSSLADFLESIQQGKITEYETEDNFRNYVMDEDISVLLLDKEP